VPLLTGDPLTTATSFVQGSIEGEALGQLTDDEILRRAAREVAICVYVIAKAMVAKAAVVVAKPAEVGILPDAGTRGMCSGCHCGLGQKARRRSPWTAKLRSLIEFLAYELTPRQR
jgi:hypothetical protein